MKTNLNLFDGLKQSNYTEKKHDKSLVTYIIVIAAAACIIFGVYFYLNNINKNYIQTQSEIMTYLESDAVLTAQTEAQSINDQLDILTQYNNEVRQAYDYIESIPQFSSSVYNEITGCKPDYVSIYGIMLNSNTITISCTTADNTPPADYAQSLDNLGVFSSVGYEGFSDTEGGYVFSISCMLA